MERSNVEAVLDTDVGPRSLLVAKSKAVEDSHFHREKGVEGMGVVGVYIMK